MDASGNAWLLLIGAFSFWWMVTSGLIALYSNRQNQDCERQLNRFCESLRLILSDVLSGPLFAERLCDHNLRVITEPDVTVILRVRKATIFSPLLASLVLILVGVAIEMQIKVGFIPREAEAVHWWLSSFAMLFCVGAVGATAYLGLHFDGVGALRELAQWDRLRNLIRKQP